jgi:hypothetical protein
MKKVAIFRQLLLITIILLTIQNAHAALLIDTGQGSGGQNLLDPTQYLAAEFTLNQAYQITAVQGWIHIYTTGAVNYKIYSDGGNVPGTTQIYSTQYTIPALSDNWYGPSGLTWELSAGTYWLSFEPISGLFSSKNSPTYPLSNYAYFNSTLGPSWTEGSSFGVRIYAEPVPIPAAVWLLGSGLIGLIGIRRFRK